MDGTSLGSVYVEVGADLSDLSAQLNGAIKEASDAGQEIGQELAAGVKGSGGLEEIASEIEAIGPALSELGTGFSELGKGMLVGGAALTEISEGIKDIAQEAVDFTGKIQLVNASLTTFFASGQQAAEVLEQIKGIEQSSIFSFPQLAGAAQQLAALGVAADKIPSTLNAIALAAEATGGSLDGATAALARIQATGQLSQRALLALGVSWDDLGKQMGISAAQAKKALSDGLGDASQIMDVVTAAITAKTKDLAGQLATTIPVALNQLKAAWDDVLGKLGQSLAPVAIQVMNALTGIFNQIGKLVDEFNMLPTPLKDIAIGLAALAVAVGPVTLALGALLFAGGEILESIPKITEAFMALKASAAGTELAEAGAAIEKTGVAATEAAEGVTALGAATSGAALAMGGFLALGVGAVIGAWLGTLKSVQEAFDAITAKIALWQEFVSWITGASAATAELQQTTDALEAKLAAQGITVDKTGLSLQDYAAKLRAAADAQGGLNAAVDGTQTRLSTFSKGAQAIITSVQGLQVQLQKAEEVLNELNQKGASTDEIVAAQNKVKSILSELGDTAAKTAKQMEALAESQSKAFDETYDAIGKIPPLMDNLDQNMGAQMAAVQAAIQKGFNFDSAIANIQKLIQKLQDGKNANTAFTQNLIASLQQTIADTSQLQDVYTKMVQQAALYATQTQKISDANSALATITDKLNTNLTFTGKVFDVLVPQMVQVGAGVEDLAQSGNDVVRVFNGGVSPAFQTLAEAARQAGLSIADFQAKTQEAALDAQAAMGNIGAASDSMVLKIKTGEADAVKSLQAALGAYTQLRAEVDNGTASQAELQRAIQMVQSAASAANIPLANVGTTMALTSDQQQQLNKALADGATAFTKLGSAAKSAGADMGQTAQEVNAALDSMDKGFDDVMNGTNLGSGSVSIPAGQVAVQSFTGAGQGGGMGQNIQFVTPAVFTGKAPGATMAETNIMDATGQTLNQVRQAQEQADVDAKAAAAQKAAADATAAANDKTTQLNLQLTNLANQMQSGWTRAKQLSQAMDVLSAQGLENTDSYKSMSDELNGIYDLNGKLDTQYQGIQAQLGETVTGLNEFGAAASDVADALTQATKAAAGFVDMGNPTTPTQTTSQGLVLPGGSTNGQAAGFFDMGTQYNVGVMPTGSGFIAPPAPTINLNMDGAIVTSQGAANELFQAAIGMLKRDAGLKL